ncbi:hypothetical protein PPACK8108_LOCUS1024 [Phakopsora pachyrhizi]|uniref:ATPase dynein-related AAA domain-containing protein n=1 Tax=Phakopsora pachyrhizi TaxID=170000 RepID=A0AAV0AIK5_PHAPC|nr:hypothetical protein PPACK8108_LOCUS1024 [Phakopsora pachyrhizi]
MMVGPSATGKTEAWRVLLAALGGLEGSEIVSYVIDPKAISKDSLYDMLDPTTWEWNKSQDTKRHWIIFDGDVDPKWVENLNSVLDGNKLLTLPNREQLSLPDKCK